MTLKWKNQSYEFSPLGEKKKGDYAPESPLSLELEEI